MSSSSFLGGLLFTSFHCLFSLVLKLKLCKNGRHFVASILWIEDIAKITHITPFFNTTNVGMVGFVDPHKVLSLRSAFSMFAKAQNESA